MAKRDHVAEKERVSRAIEALGEAQEPENMKVMAQQLKQLRAWLDGYRSAKGLPLGAIPGELQLRLVIPKIDR